MGVENSDDKGGAQELAKDREGGVVTKEQAEREEAFDKEHSTADDWRDNLK